MVEIEHLKYLEILHVHGHTTFISNVLTVSAPPAT